MSTQQFRFKSWIRVLLLAAGLFGSMFFAYTGWQFYGEDRLFCALCGASLLFCMCTIYVSINFYISLTETSILKKGLRTIEIGYQDIASLEIYHDSARVVGKHSNFWIKKDIEGRTELTEKVYRKVRDTAEIAGDKEEIDRLEKKDKS